MENVKNNSENKNVGENKINSLKSKLDKLNLTSSINKSTKQLYKKTAETFNGLKYSELAESLNTKKFRTAARKDLLLLASNINSCVTFEKDSTTKFTVKEVSKARLKEVTELFNEYYSQNYLVNDFTVASLYDGSKEENISFYQKMLNVVKSVK